MWKKKGWRGETPKKARRLYGCVLLFGRVWTVDDRFWEGEESADKVGADGLLLEREAIGLFA